MFSRIIATVLLLVLGGTFQVATRSATGIAAGMVAGSQFQNSNVAAIGHDVAQNTLSMIAGFVPLAALITLGIIWIPFLIRKGISTFPLIGAIAFGLATLGAPEKSYAYYGKTDQPEFFQILPNESAFFIPNTGANKDTQTHMESEDYYNANKIATKLFMIPHTSVPSGYGLGSLFGGYVVPAGRLILVDRRPYHREWTAPGRGTDKGSDESFHCQTNDGLNVDVEISISTYVTEDNAAKFLYFFGVKSDPNEDRSDPNNIFRSVYHGYSLTEVMDGVARGNVHNSVCDEMSKYALADANKHMYDIMQDIRKNTATYLIQKGITLDYIGWAGTWAFDPSIQAAVNRNFESTQDQAVAKALAPYADTLMNLAFVEATREISQKWNGALPTTLSGLWLFPSSLLDGVKKIASAILPQEPVMHKGPVTNDDYH